MSPAGAPNAPFANCCKHPVIPCDCQLRLASRNGTVRVVSTPEGSTARWVIARAADTLSSRVRGPQEPLADLARLRHAVGLLQRAEILLIDAARRDGRSWAEIAAARGTSRQNEHQAAERRAVRAARDPLDQWIERVFARFAREEQEKRRKSVIGW